MKKVGNFLIDMDRSLGQGQYGKVYLAQEIPEQINLGKGGASTPGQKSGTKSQGSMGDIITKAQLSHNNGPSLFACKVVERKDLCHTKENLIVSEIQNQDSVQSKYVVKMRKAIKTDARYYIFMEFCNGSDLKELMEVKKWKITPNII